MTQPSETDENDVAANLARLEAALERIAQGSAAHAGSVAPSVMPSQSAMLIDRLDAVIAKLRSELGDASAEGT